MKAYTSGAGKQRVGQTQTDAGMSRLTRGIVDNRPQAIAQRQLLERMRAGGARGGQILRPAPAVGPNQIPKMIRQALPSVRSIGSGNPSVEFIARLITHPSFQKMGGPEKQRVKGMFGTRDEHTVLRQAFFPASECNRSVFKSDSFHDGGKQIVLDAYEVIKAL